MDTLNNVESFSIESFLPQNSGCRVSEPSFQPYSIKRLHDGEVFALGDTVTNGTQMVGTITGFEMLENKVYVNHTWSGIGMNLGSLKKVIQLPSQHEIGDEVLLSINQSFGDNPYPFTAKVLAVHFYANKVKYDLEIPIADENPTRIYNIDSCFVIKK